MPITYNLYPTLDDLLHDVFEELLGKEVHEYGSKKSNSEVLGVSMGISDARARLSRSENRSIIFTALGELLWYLSGSNKLDFIGYYIKDYEKESVDKLTIWGAYGPRLFQYDDKYDQVRNVISLLKDRPTSRKAIISLLHPRDLADRHPEFPCTCTLQFFIRHGRLQMLTSMRSNDAFMGLPHDVFAFTMLQEIVARSLNIDVGSYYHSVGSLHLYSDKFDRAQRYLKEGYQETMPLMPPMPEGDPWQAIKELIKVEYDLRKGNDCDVLALGWHPYWKNLAVLLKVWSLYINEQREEMPLYRNALNECYHPFIDKWLLL